MALDDSALLEMIEMLRTADGGDLMRRLLGGMLRAVIDAEPARTSRRPARTHPGAHDPAQRHAREAGHDRCR